MQTGRAPFSFEPGPSFGTKPFDLPSSYKSELYNTNDPSSSLSSTKMPSMSSLTLPSSMYHKTLQTEVHLLSVAEKQEEIRRLRVIMQEITCLEAMAAPSSALLEELLEDCLDDLAREVCFEEHYQAKKELALRAQTPAQKKAKTSHDLYGLPYRKVPDSIFRCENCKQKVSVTKYAPHLENCLYGIGRAARAGRASRNRRGATKGYGSGKKNKRGGDAGGKSNPDESDGWDSFDAEQNYNTADRATVMSRVGRQAVNGVKCNKTGNIKNGSGNKSGNGNGKHCKSKKNSKKNSTGNNHTTQNQHQTSTKTSTNPQSSAGGWGAATTSAMDTSTSVKSKGIGKGSGNAGDEGKKKKRGEKRKRAVRGQGEYWSDPLPADLPTHATRGGYPYACQPDDPAVVNSTAPSVESLEAMFAKVCGVPSGSTNRMCVYKRNGCSHHTDEERRVHKMNVESGRVLVRIKKLRSAR